MCEEDIFNNVLNKMIELLVQAVIWKHWKARFYQSLWWAYNLCECLNVYVILSQKKDAEVVAGQARRPTRRFMDLVEQDVKLADVRDEQRI